jgi:predicted Zn-dependent peptidase
MRQGGAGELSAEALDKELEHLAAGIAGSFGAEFGKFSFSCLGSDVDRVFSLFADVILRPRFQEDRIDLWKGQALEGIRRRSDDPGTIASIAFNQILYDSTPYGRVVVDKDVQAITRAELIKMHQEMVTPRDAVLIISGNISRIAAEELIHKYFAKWGENDRVLPPVPVVSSEPQPGIYFLEYPFAQSTVLMGQLGPKRLSPDYPQIEEFNEVFGSAGFSARLARRVRTELGLAYGVFGGILAGVDRGRALVQLQTKSESTGQAIVEAIEVIKGLQAAEATESELAEAQRSITNSFVFKFDSTEELIQRAALLQILGYPQDYDATFVPKIKNVDGADVQTVARKYWDPAKFVIVVVGNERAYNSLQRVLDEQPSALPGFKIQKMQFDQKLVM